MNNPVRTVHVRVLMVLLVALAASSAGAWEVETVDDDGIVGFHCSITIDQFGYPHIAYVDRDPNELKVARRQGPSWIVEVVDQAPGISVSIALGENDRAAVSYTDTLGARLRCARQNQTGGWTLTIVDPADYTGYQTSILVDTDDRPHISYFDWANERCWYAVQGTGGWERQQVSLGISGDGTSIGTNQTGDIWVAFFKHGEDYLRYARISGGSTAYATLTSPGAGASPSLEVDRFSHVHVACQDATIPGSELLLYIYEDGTGTHQETVDIPRIAEMYPSLELDSQGIAHIAYVGGETRPVRYARREESGWVSETVDSQVEAYWTSMALDGNDNPHICYYDELTSDLKYAHLAWTPTPTAVPTAVPTASLSYDLDMPDTLLEPGDDFLLRRICSHRFPSVITVDEYIVLDYLGNYWFWPGWTQDLDFDPSTLSPDQDYTRSILEFVWPSDTGSQDGIKFWGAFLEEGSVDLLVIDSIEWAYFE